MASSRDRLRAAARIIGDRTVLITCWIEVAETKKRDWDFCYAYLGTSRLCKITLQEIEEWSRLGLKLENQDYRSKFLSAEVFVGGLDSTNEFMHLLPQDNTWLVSEYVHNSMLNERSASAVSSNNHQSQSRILPFNHVVLNFGSPFEEMGFQLERRTMKEGEKLALNRLTTLFENHTLADVTFVVGAEEFSAHAAILANASPVFLAMFQHNFKENCNRIVYIEDVRPIIFKSLLEYIYTGSVSTLSEDHFEEDLLIAAEKYGILCLKEECSTAIGKKLSEENVIPVLILAHRHSASKLFQMAMDFMARNRQKVCSLPDYEELMEFHPKICLQVTRYMLGAN